MTSMSTNQVLSAMNLHKRPLGSGRFEILNGDQVLMSGRLRAINRYLASRPDCPESFRRELVAIGLA